MTGLARYQGLQTPIPYFGSKGKMAPFIAGLLPPHQHYVEVFAGSLAVLFAKRPSRMETANDLDGTLMTFWRMIRDRYEDFVWVAMATPHARAELALDPRGAPDELECARRVWSLLVQGRAAKMKPVLADWRWRVETTHGSIQDSMRRSIVRMHPAMQRLHNVSLENIPALEIIAKYGQNPDVCLYSDPPYPDGLRATKDAYRCEMPDEAQHRELAAALSTVKASVVVSGYRSALYDELYDGWYVEEFPTQTSQGGEGKATCEVLWGNRPLGGRIQGALFE